MARIGIIENADGTFSASPCRAKDVNRGRGRCKHFKHVSSKDEANQYISIMTTHKDDMGNVDVDMNDIAQIGDKFHDYLEDRGYKAPTNADSSILMSWFHGDTAKASKMLLEAQNEGIIPHVQMRKSLASDVNNLISSDIGVTVVSGRYIGLTTPEEDKLNTDVMMLANGITSKQFSGEPPVTLMVASGDGDKSASSNVRSTFVNKNRVEMSSERKKDFADNAGYACLHGAKVE